MNTDFPYDPSPYTSSVPALHRNLIVHIVRYPTILSLLGDQWKSAYKACLEMAASRIEGFIIQQRFQFTAIGPTVTQPPIIPTFKYMERIGLPIQCFWLALQDEMAHRGTYLNKTLNSDSDFFTGEVMFIEPSLNGDGVANAWLATNFYPSAVDVSPSGLNLDNPDKPVGVTVRFSTTIDQSADTRAHAVDIMHILSFTGSCAIQLE